MNSHDERGENPELFATVQLVHCRQMVTESSGNKGCRTGGKKYKLGEKE